MSHLSDEAEPCVVCNKPTFRYDISNLRMNVCQNDGSWVTQDVPCKIPLCDACDEHIYSDD